MLNQYYIKTENRINYAKKYPNTGIKCSVCQLIFSIHQIENHMSLHIAPQYMAPNTKPNEIKKLSRPKIFFQKQNEFMSSALKSIRKQELPKYETVRNFKGIPSHLDSISYQKHRGPQFLGTQITNYDPMEAETALDVNDVEKDNFQRQNIQENLLLTQENVHIQKSSIQVYKTQQPQKTKITFQSTGNSWAGSTKMQEKQWLQPKFDDQSTYQAYEITVKKQKEAAKGYLTFEAEPQQTFEVNLQKYKPPEVRSNSICTKTKEKKELKKSLSFQFLTQIFGCKQSSTQTKKGEIVIPADKADTVSSFYRTPNQQFYSQKEHKCKDCNGFYCATCQSTIPPQYRPVNVFAKDQKALQFYRNTVYRNGSCGNLRQLGQEKDCKDCAQ